MNHYLKADRVIKKLIREGKTKFILFPFGEQGMLVKNILNMRYGIIEEGIVDNGLAINNTDIMTLDELGQRELGDTLILLTSDNEDIYSEIRYQLLSKVKFNQIIDVFSPSMYFDEAVFYEDASYSEPRIAALESVAKEIYYNGVEGAIAECGVYKGKFANYISRFMPDRKFFLFDTFSGFDGRDIDEKEDPLSYEFRAMTNLDDTSVKEALSNIGYRSNAIVRKGYFPDTAEGLENEKFSFVHLDTDLYKPILAGLEFFWPRLNKGGVIFVDDLRHPQLLGVREAVDEFCRKEGIGYFTLQNVNRGVAILAKPR